MGVVVSDAEVDAPVDPVSVAVGAVVIVFFPFVNAGELVKGIQTGLDNEPALCNW